MCSLTGPVLCRPGDGMGAVSDPSRNSRSAVRGARTRAGAVRPGTGAERRSRWRSWVLRAGLAGCSVVLTILLLEWFVRLAAPQPLNFYNFALLNATGAVRRAPNRTGGSRYRIDFKPPGTGPMRANVRMRNG